MPEQQLHPVAQCLLCPLKCLLGILLMPFVMAFALVFAIFFLGPLVYYRSTILNSNALSEKYVEEGIRLEGRVVKRWKTGEGSDAGPTYHVRVAYRVNEEGYAKALVVSQEMFPQATLELIRLSEYPQSAILYASVKDVDPDFPPSKVGSLFFAFFWLTLWNLLPTAIVLSSIETCTFCSMLIAPFFVGLVVLEMVVGYWVARKDRDSSLRSTLFGAKRIGEGNNNNDDVALPKSVSYQEFFQEDTHSFLFVVRNILQDVCIVLGCIVAFVYFLVLGGGYSIMYSLVVARWINQLLETYESSSDTVSGSVVRRQHSNKVTVQYQVDDQMYKKRLTAPYRLVRNGCRRRIEYDTVGDSPELVYLRDTGATSACLKSRIDNRHEEANRLSQLKWSGLFLMIIQVTMVTLFVGLSIQDEKDTIGVGPYLFVAGIYLACEIIFGLAGACLYYRFYFRQKLLYGAKKVNPRQVHHDDTGLDEELDVAVLWSDGTDGTEATLSTTDESADADTFVNNFMKGKFPRFDKAFA